MMDKKQVMDQTGFDNWAPTYEQTVFASDISETFPFAGYNQVLKAIPTMLPPGKALNILDIGFGTGKLTQKLYKQGHRIHGVDFAENMVRIAQQKMTKAALQQYDFSAGFPQVFKDKSFDAILCTYALHHLTPGQQQRLITQCIEHLTPKGLMLIGDISFATQRELEACRLIYKDEWDEAEYYLIHEEMQKHYSIVEYQQHSFCAAVYVLAKK